MGNGNGERLNKYLSEAGICSRREADRQIEAGNVLINGRAATVGQRVLPEDEVTFMGIKVGGKQKPVLLLVNKPIGIVSTAEKREKNNIVDFINYPTRLYPVGRLDKDSHG
ncbi:MAG: 23S rRNA pseudouridine synthase F, partial [Lachnospiraceae bacterium]|nr:23S rRNA pseudouridine synthase F [Lachnospiraceae bacterium]